LMPQNRISRCEAMRSGTVLPAAPWSWTPFRASVDR
jgi:hypothetical protein